MYRLALDKLLKIFYTGVVLARLSTTEMRWILDGLKPITMTKEEHNTLFHRKIDNKHKARYYKNLETGDIFYALKPNFLGFLLLVAKVPFVLVKNMTSAFVEVFSELFGYFSRNWCYVGTHYNR